MRPLSLQVEGFTSFRRRLSLDFNGLDLFAITGPTGVGKSSLIDALVFALYGQVPRVGDDYKQLITQGAERLSVLLEFETGKGRYRIARTARRAGASKQLLERVEGEETEPLGDRVREIRTQVEKIVGLDYDGFIRSVVLPQGQFDAFLKGEPRERRKILVSLLNLGVYEAMQKLANQRGSDARKESGFIAEQLERDFAGATPEALEARKAELETVREECSSFDKALAALADGVDLARSVRAARLEDRSLQKDAVLEGRKREEAVGIVTGSEATRAKLEAELARVTEEIREAAPDEGRGPVLAQARTHVGQLVDLRSQRDRVDRQLKESAKRLEKAEAARDGADRGVPAAEEARKAAEVAVDEAREKKEHTHRQHAAVALRRELETGEPCPVCEQTVPKIPKGRAPGLDAVEKALTRAETAAKRAVSAAEKARLELQAAQSRVEELGRETDSGEARREELEATEATVLAALAAAGVDEAEAADAARLSKRLDAEVRSLEAAARRREGLEERKAAVEEKRARFQAELAAAQAQRDAAQARLDEIGAKRSTVAAALEEAEKALVSLASREGWEDLADADDGAEVELLETRRRQAQARARELASRQGALGGEVERLEEQIVRAGELRERRASLEAEGALLKTLADHLRANELVAWIQEEALRRLAEDGSHHLAALSQGRYELRLGSGSADPAGGSSRAEQDFFVVDRWNADGVRSVKTLSGGETFLASLALALALAESLARLSAGGHAVEALDSLFLDEGFGTLDGETLDTVVGALDALHGGRRLVGIVTHVRELAERMPARLEVRRDGTTAVASVV